jgi:hypothetical protein
MFLNILSEITRSTVYDVFIDDKEKCKSTFLVMCRRKFPGAKNLFVTVNCWGSKCNWIEIKYTNVKRENVEYVIYNDGHATRNGERFSIEWVNMNPCIRHMDSLISDLNIEPCQHCMV